MSDRIFSASSVLNFPFPRIPRIPRFKIFSCSLVHFPDRLVCISSRTAGYADGYESRL